MPNPTLAAGAVDLSDAELRRYARHIILPEVGLEGQKKLKAARVLAVGAGGLGSPLVPLSCRRGHRHSGCRRLRHRRRVEPPAAGPLRRRGRGAREAGCRVGAPARPQPGPCGSARFASASRRPTRSTSLRDFDVVADGTDNFPTRYLVNDACVLLGKPNAYAAIYRFEGQASVFGAPGGPCYRCLHPEPPPPGLVPSCAEAGVLGVLPGLLGVIQAAEVIKLVLGLGRDARGAAAPRRRPRDAVPRDRARNAIPPAPSAEIGRPCGA